MWMNLWRRSAINTADRGSVYGEWFKVQGGSPVRDGGTCGRIQNQNRSLNNYVETLLLDAVYSEPNETTLAAMKEAQSGALRNSAPLDLSSIEAMERSMGL